MMKTLALLLALGACSALPAPLSAESGRPNILFIFSDDQRFDTLGVVNPLIRTPHLDQLARTGVRFDRAYAATAICSPSRAAVLSGRYGTRNGVATLSGALNFPDHTFAQFLQGAGYRTAHFGKWHLGTTPSAAGFAHYARINSNGSWFHRTIDSNIPGMPATLGGTFYEEFMADAVIDFLEGHVATSPDRPFLLWWCNQVPHLDGSLRYPDVGNTRATYDAADMPVPANWADDPATWGPPGTKPGYLASSRFVTKSTTENYGGPGGYTNSAPGLRHTTIDEDNVQEHLREYYAAITALDVQIGRVLARLADPNGDGDPADSIEDDTWIVFMGDNGWQTGSHKFTSKVLAYEESARVPLIVKGPGIAPRVEDKLVLNLDVTPMILDLARLPAAPHHQGANLRTLVEEPATPWRSHLYYEAVVPEASLGAEPHDAVRDDRYKLIRTYDESSSNTVVFEELYDLRSDPGEMANQAANPAYASIKSGLETALVNRKAAVAGSPDPAPTAVSSGNLLSNPSFDTGDKTSWNANGSDTSSVVPTPLDGGSHSLQFNTGSATSWVEQTGLDLQNFKASWLFQYDGTIRSRAMNAHLRSGGQDRLNIRINPAGTLQFYDGSDWTTPSNLTGANNFKAATVYRFEVTGTAWGDPTATAPAAGTYRLSWQDLADGSSSGSYSSQGQANHGYRHAMPNTLENGELDGIRFLDDFGDPGDPDWRVDAVSIEAADPATGFLEIDPTGPSPDFRFGLAAPPATLSRTAFVRNRHPTDSIAVTEACLLGTGAAVFSLGPITPALPVTLAPGASVAIEVTAESAVAGSFTGELLVATDRPLQNLLLPLTVEFQAPNLLRNGGFEETPFDAGWTSSGVVTESGLNGSATAARLGFNTSATLGQQVGPLADFTFDATLQVAGTNTAQSFRILLDGESGTAVEIRGALGNVLQLNHHGSFGDLTSLAGGASFPIPANTPIRIRIVGHDFGSALARYDLAWSDPGSSFLNHSAIGLTSFASAAAATAGPGLTAIRFDRNDPAAHSYWVDDVGVSAATAGVPAADHEFVPPPLPRIVRISGVYPHLAMTNNHSEVGPGAIAPFAGKLWVVTYGPHLPNGDSSNKLYEIDRNLVRTTRPESVGGTPANRMIHPESNQLFIGHHAIAADGTVRTIPVASMPGRMTGIARHLTDPANRLYQATMEEGFYEVDVHSLAVTPLYADTNGSTDNFGAPDAGLPGVHGKGLYSAQGRLVYSNNGSGGGLSQWDGTSWSTVRTDKFTEVTGPGGLTGNRPGDDRLWAVGWDSRSLLLTLLEDGTWHSFRLPKSSYTHDADPGWYTEWPRIRQLDPAAPGSPYLMHMHGMFFDFPSTFSSANFSGLRPISSYHKMPVDYCLFDDRLVIAKNDTSRFSNALAPRAQSNLWWGRFEDLARWGAPQGHGGVWLREAVAENETSDPFLVNGFSRITLHLRHDEAGGAEVPVRIETGSGDGTWTVHSTVSVAPGRYRFAVLNDLPAEWIRLRAEAPSPSLTAYLLLSNPYPHTTPPSLAGNEFAALADIRDTDGHSDGVIRVMPGADLQLEFASDSGYHRIGADLVLRDVSAPTAETDLRAGAALRQDFGSDPASAWIDDDGIRLRLPKLDARYDLPFRSGWARGFRETVTERGMLNCHGTFYEIPRSNSGGLRRLRPLATHGKRITDFATWRGLLVLTGVLDDAPSSDALVRNLSGNAALWLGEIDDIWRMGEPRGTGGPWLDSPVAAGAASDPFLMYGYDRKELRLSHRHDGPVTITVEVDFLGDDTWVSYDSFVVDPGATATHLFPTGFHAHWVRLRSDTATTASARFRYGPADCRDGFLDWAREHGLPTGAGRSGLAARNEDGDSLNTLAEWFYRGDPRVFDPSPFTIDPGGSSLLVTTRDLDPKDPLTFTLEGSPDLLTWSPRPDLEQPGVDQAGVAAGFTRRSFRFEPGRDHYFLRGRLGSR